MNTPFETVREAPRSTEAMLFPEQFEGDELTRAVLLLAERLGVRIVRTNQTKHGNTEIQLENVDDQL